MYLHAHAVLAVPGQLPGAMPKGRPTLAQSSPAVRAVITARRSSGSQPTQRAIPVATAPLFHHHFPQPGSGAPPQHRGDLRSTLILRAPCPCRRSNHGNTPVPSSRSAPPISPHGARSTHISSRSPRDRPDPAIPQDRHPEAHLKSIGAISERVCAIE